MINIPPVTQETDYYCGPAVAQALLSYQGHTITQTEFVSAAGIETWIKGHGTQPQHFEEAVRSLAPECAVLQKNKATVADLVELVTKQKLPVAVNWQGLFYENPSDEQSYPNLEDGHYSIVVAINVEKNTITLMDPYPEFSDKPRTFDLNWFEERWWDIGEYLDEKTGNITKSLTNNLLFVIIKKPEYVEVSKKVNSNA